MRSDVMYYPMVPPALQPKTLCCLLRIARWCPIHFHAQKPWWGSVLIPLHLRVADYLKGHRASCMTYPVLSSRTLLLLSVPLHLLSEAAFSLCLRVMAALSWMQLYSSSRYVCIHRLHAEGDLVLQGKLFYKVAMPTAVLCFTKESCWSGFF